jgi:hypothetical protein
MKPIFEAFARLLEERLTAETFTTEDSVRYTFFLALTENGYCKHTDILLEMPHPSSSKAEVDLFIHAGDSRPSTAFEFKYDRPIPSEKNAPRTQKAGAVFKDLFRLAHVPKETATQRFFIYLTAQEMANYFRNPANHLSSFFELPEGQCYSLTTNFVLGQVATFRNVVGDWPITCQLTGAFRRNLSQQHFLRIFVVGPTS